MFCAVFQQGCSALAVQVAAHDTASALYLKWEIFYAYTPPVLKDLRETFIHIGTYTHMLAYINTCAG